MTTPIDPPSPAVEAKPAATVMLLRDGPRGIEVFMVVRNPRIRFASGALVFPGGKVDPEDRDAALRAVYTPADNLERPTFALRASAVREVFEETGVLLARARGSREALPAAQAADIAARHRAALLANETTMLDIAQREELDLLGGELAYFAHWITPRERPQRFDTHFFLVPMPAGQQACHDGEESVDSEWICAAEAAAAIAERRFKAMFPTLVNLEKLAESATVAEALQRAWHSPVVTVEPVVVTGPDGTEISRITDAAGYRTTSHPFVR